MLIDSDNLIDRIDKCYQESAKTGLGLEPVMAIRDIKALISVMPTVDAAPVVHGRWETDSTEQNEFWGHYCNRCSTYLPYGRDWRPNYCPECGAKMDLEEQHHGNEQHLP